MFLLKKKGDLRVCSEHINNNRFNIYKDEVNISLSLSCIHVHSDTITPPNWLILIVHVKKQQLNNNNNNNNNNKQVKEVARFAKFVESLPLGRVVLITITDTAIAAKRPPGRELYEALSLIGGSIDMERIG
jgi:hypothetical protein